MVANLYYKLEVLLDDAISIRGDFKGIDQNLANAAQAGMNKFSEYHDIMKVNQTFYIASLLDPRIKTNWLRKNVPNADQIIDDIKTFIKKAYPCEVELPEHPTVPSKKRNLELDFLEEYASIVTVNNDVDRYFNDPPVIYVKNTKED
jgi:hypothetical protein